LGLFGINGLPRKEDDWEKRQVEQAQKARCHRPPPRRGKRAVFGGGRDRKRTIRFFHKTLNASRLDASRAGRYTATGEEPSVPAQPVERKLAASPPPILQAAEAARSANRPTNNLTTCDLYLRAHARVISAVKDIPRRYVFSLKGSSEIRVTGPALAWGAFCYFRLCEAVAPTFPG
jgi:hypothetical protein